MNPSLNPKFLRTQGYINGQWVDADTGARFMVYNPADGAEIIAVADMGADETTKAIDAAHAAFPAWAKRTAGERSAILRKWFELIMQNADDLAALLTAEQGKPLSEARGEVIYGASFIEWYAEEAKRIYGDVIPSTGTDRRFIVLKQPIGVVGAITPWNFPSAMITRKVAPALAAGCTAVVKPAEDTPLSALALAVLAQEAGLPPGVFNLVPTRTPAPVGSALTADPRVRKISFTGSTAVGKVLMAQAAQNITKVSLELGGNAPFLVFDDADLDAAVEGALASKYRNAGQTCVCANRFYVQDGIHDEFAQRLADRTAELMVGRGDAPNVQIGPLINTAAMEKVERLMADAKAKGANIITGGDKHAAGDLYYTPTVITQVTPDMEIANTEIFGPVSALRRFSTEEEAIALANDTPFGLAAYFFARDMGRVWRVMEGLETGIVAVNTGLFTSEVAPFGGVKQSGIGREGSKYGIEEFVEIKNVCLAGL
ncbi:MAG: NAD-dependent succinate-semialdehyde dehydrogenase [Robiginitomaculum sp.]|nr:NAD-dependent succinate-semialdehyde dehydrogenase [Robiginitomaculum sp.]MDQ7076995.1 NAD-dependent succinate-semialdehyde dehydrogenase [Robiginitomaculum sp.]